jgi:hypothetical protein
MLSIKLCKVDASTTLMIDFIRRGAMIKSFPAVVEKLRI